MIDVDLMREYVRLVESRSVSTVAWEFYLNQSTVTKHMQRLERELDAILLERDTHSVEVTEMGQTVYEGFKDISERFDQTLRELELRKSGFAGTLRIGVLYHAISSLVNPSIARFIDEYPNVSLQFVSLQSHEVCERLRTGQIDAGFVFSGDNTDGLRTKPVASPRIMCVVDRRDDLVQIGSVDSALLVSRKIAFPTPEMSEELFGAMGIQPKCFQPVENLDSISLAIKPNESVAVLDEFLDGKLGESLRFLPFEPSLGRTSYLAACRENDRRQLVEMFMNSVVALSL